MGDRAQSLHHGGSMSILFLIEQDAELLISVQKKKMLIC
jgi:hypothetical protein